MSTAQNLRQLVYTLVAMERPILWMDVDLPILSHLHWQAGPTAASLMQREDVSHCTQTAQHHCMLWEHCQRQHFGQPWQC